MSSILTRGAEEVETGGSRGSLDTVPCTQATVPHSCTTATSQDMGCEDAAPAGVGVQVHADFTSVPTKGSLSFSPARCALASPRLLETSLHPARGTDEERAQGLGSCRMLPAPSGGMAEPGGLVCQPGLFLSRPRSPSGVSNCSVQLPRGGKPGAHAA